MRHEGLEVSRIHRGQFCSGQNGRGGDHGVKTVAAFGGGKKEQLTGQLGGGFVEGEDAGQEAAGRFQKEFWHRLGDKLHPCHRGSGEGFRVRYYPRGRDVMGIGGVRNPDDEIGVEMNHRVFDCD